MSRDLDDLTAEMRAQTEALLEACGARGYTMRPFFTLRTPQEQARLWRQSRTTEEINARIDDLETSGAPFLAQVIRDAGPQNGRKVTNAVPGFSWHQWGEAVDCFWLVDGRAEWSSRRKMDGQNGYAVYADEATALGLDAGGRWRSFKDWPHVQLRSDSHPGRIYSLSEINEEMSVRFG